jgi:hypothetical protein
MSIQYNPLDNHELKLLKIESPSNKLKLSQFFDRKFSMNKIQIKKDSVKSIKSQFQKNNIEQKNILSQSIEGNGDMSYMKSTGDYQKEGLGNGLVPKNDYIKSRMYCRLMHTKRGNLWNELHKLDKKRIKLLMNKFVIQKDHEAMQYIIKNQQKELAEKNSKLKQKLLKVEDIKRFKIKQKITNFKKLKNIEKKNFESVIRYLKDTIPENDLKHMLVRNKTKRKKKKKKCVILPKKEIKYKAVELNLGEQKLFNKLSKINNNIYQQVYEETQKKFTSSKRKISRCLGK